MKKAITLVLLFFVWQYFYAFDRSPAVGVGILAGSPPFTSLPNRPRFQFDGYTIIPRFAIEVDGRVLDAEKYYFDGISRVSPVDVVLGWEELSDERTIESADPSIVSRRYSWETDSPIVNSQTIKSKTALYHLIPATQAIGSQLKQLKIGQILTIRGHLVNVKSSTGLKWQTGASKDLNSADEKQGELLFIDQIDIIEPHARVYF